MRKLLFVTAAAFLCASFATAQQTAPTTTATATVTQPESELVRAARQSTRKGKKPANVITNATLKRHGSKAHITTTKVQPPLGPMPESSPAPAKKPDVVIAPKSTPAAPAGKPTTLATAVDDAEDPLSEADPAQAEKLAEQAAKAAAEKQTGAEKKPPQR